MRIVTVYFDNPKPMGYPFDNPKYLEAYQFLTDEAAKEGIELRISRGPETYIGSMEFDGYYLLKDQTPTYHDQRYTTEFVYVKGKKQRFADTEQVLNVFTIRDICNDKVKTYQTFPEYAVPTYPITRETMEHALEQIATDTIVIKPNCGEEGKGIIICSKAELTPEQISQSEPMAIQPFIDTSGGVPGLSQDKHDHRIILSNGEIISSYIRTPAEGSLLANIALGASLAYVEAGQIPDSAHQVITYVEKQFHLFSPRLYTIDLVYDNGTPKIMELNDQPGLHYLSQGDQARKFNRHLITMFMNGLTDS